MAYTILTFSVIVVDGLRKLEQEVSDAERDAFIHTWAVVGAMMGVREDLLPRDYASARRLLDSIRDSQAARTDDGVLLTSRTIDAFHGLLRTRALPGFIATRSTAVLVVRTLLDPHTAELTGVQKLTLLQRLVAVPLMHLATLGVGLVDWIAHHDRAPLFIQRLVSRHMVEHLSALSSADQKTLFWIPDQLRESWGDSAQSDGERGPMSPTLPLTTRIEWIVGLDDQPALRNLLITQCYHDLSSGLARVLGPDDVNWCTFATWASKTAGRFIRNQEIPGIFRGLLTDSPEFRTSAQRAAASVEAVHPDAAMPPDSLLQLAEEVAGDVSGQITAGNLAVFSELAPIFARFVALFDDGPPDDRAAAELLDSLRVGPSNRGGQSLLRQALEHLLAASREQDPRKRAALMLISNAQTGLHEQIRLQPYIAGSLKAPIDDTVGRLLDQHAAKLRGHPLLSALHAVWDCVSHAIVRDASNIWCDLQPAS